MIGWKKTWLFQVNRLKFTNPDTPKQVIFSSASHQNYILKGAHHTVPNQGRVSHFSRSFAKDGVPRPVTGSHPGTALKPGVLHPGLFPDVMSWKAEEKASEYICDWSQTCYKHPGAQLTAGFMKPIGFFPIVKRASFTIARIEPTTGAEADVPNTRANRPLTLLSFSVIRDRSKWDDKYTNRDYILRSEIIFLLVRFKSWAKNDPLTR